jgi:hypothetical protein
MKRKKLSKSTRKFIRKEKTRISAEVFNIKEREKKIKELYKKFYDLRK